MYCSLSNKQAGCQLVSRELWQCITTEGLLKNEFNFLVLGREALKIIVSLGMFKKLFSERRKNISVGFFLFDSLQIMNGACDHIIWQYLSIQLKGWSLIHCLILLLLLTPTGARDLWHPPSCDLQKKVLEFQMPFLSLQWVQYDLVYFSLLDPVLRAVELLSGLANLIKKIVVLHACMHTIARTMIRIVQDAIHQMLVLINYLYKLKFMIGDSKITLYFKQLFGFL